MINGYVIISLLDIARTTIIKSNIAIVDISDDNPNVMYELGLVQADKGNKNTIIVAEEGTASSLIKRALQSEMRKQEN